MLGDGARTQIGCASTSDEDKDAICEGAEWIGALVVEWLSFKMHALAAGLVHVLWENDLVCGNAQEATVSRCDGLDRQKCFVWKPLSIYSRSNQLYLNFNTHRSIAMLRLAD